VKGEAPTYGIILRRTNVPASAMPTGPAVLRALYKCGDEAVEEALADAFNLQTGVEEPTTVYGDGVLSAASLVWLCARLGGVGAKEKTFMAACAGQFLPGAVAGIHEQVKAAAAAGGGPAVLDLPKVKEGMTGAQPPKGEGGVYGVQRDDGAKVGCSVFNWGKRVRDQGGKGFALATIMAEVVEALAAGTLTIHEAGIVMEGLEVLTMQLAGGLPALPGCKMIASPHTDDSAAGGWW
jgi:hypothetical protein